MLAALFGEKPTRHSFPTARLDIARSEHAQAPSKSRGFVDRTVVSSAAKSCDRYGTGYSDVIMSRPAKPKPNGEPPDHRIQLHQDHVQWLKARKAMRENGLPTLAALLGFLLSQEYRRLGITDELVLEEEERANARRAQGLGKKKRSATS